MGVDRPSLEKEKLWSYWARSLWIVHTICCWIRNPTRTYFNSHRALAIQCIFLLKIWTSCAVSWLAQAVELKWENPTTVCGELSVKYIRRSRVNFPRTLVSVQQQPQRSFCCCYRYTCPHLGSLEYLIRYPLVTFLVTTTPNGSSGSDG